MSDTAVREASAWFPAERVARALRLPAISAGRYGEAIGYAQVLCRDGSAYAAPADDVHMVDLLSGNKVLLLRTWIADWTARPARVVGEVRHASGEAA
jgi:hypothetical protein